MRLFYLQGSSIHMSPVCEPRIQEILYYNTCRDSQKFYSNGIMSLLLLNKIVHVIYLNVNKFMLLFCILSNSYYKY